MSSFTVVATIKGNKIRWTGDADDAKSAKRKANAAFGVKRSTGTMTYKGEAPAHILAKYALA